MGIEFELAVCRATHIASRFPFYRATRVAEKEGEPHIIIYVTDNAFNRGDYRNAIPESVAVGDTTYTVGIAPESEAMDLLLALWKITADGV